MGIFSRVKKTVKKLTSNQLVQRAGALVAPITLLPALVDKGYRKNTGPIYAGYAAIGAGALGAAAAGLGSAGAIAAGTAGASPLVGSVLNSGGSAGAAAADAGGIFAGADGMTPMDAGGADAGAGAGGSADGFFSGSSPSGAAKGQAWLWGIAAALVGVLVLLIVRRKGLK